MMFFFSVDIKACLGVSVETGSRSIYAACAEPDDADAKSIACKAASVTVGLPTAVTDIMAS
jgi:hypothetical protein